MIIQCAAQRGPIHFGNADANSERARTLTVMEQKCHKNWKSVPVKLMFFLWGYVYLNRGMIELQFQPMREENWWQLTNHRPGNRYLDQPLPQRPVVHDQRPGEADQGAGHAHHEDAQLQDRIHSRFKDVFRMILVGDATFVFKRI